MRPSGIDPRDLPACIHVPLKPRKYPLGPQNGLLPLALFRGPRTGMPAFALTSILLDEWRWQCTRCQSVCKLFITFCPELWHDGDIVCPDLEPAYKIQLQKKVTILF